MNKICIVLVGATAVGKTEWAIKLARYFNTKIISADSRQCYQEISIGVAKPSSQYLNEIPHYFINSHSIHDVVNVKVFEAYALQSINTIFQQNNISIVVGGTGLYIDALCNGIDDIPPIDENTRNHIRQEFANRGVQWLQETIKQEDPLFFNIGENKNPHRLLRALEVMRSYQKSILEFQKKSTINRHFKIIKIGLTLPKELLVERIIKRTQTMIQEGLDEEVLSLKPYWHLQALQTVGYKEWIPYFENKINVEQVQEQIIIHTRQYAKRQTTWFKKDNSIHWISPQENLQSLIHWIEQQIANIE